MDLENKLATMFSKGKEHVTSFLDYITTSDGGDAALNSKIVDGNLAVLEQMKEKEHHLAEREGVKTERERNEMLLRKKDLEFFDRRDGATAEVRIAKAVAEETRKKQEEEDRLAREKTEAERKLLESQKQRAQEEERKEDAEWSTEKNHRAIATKRVDLDRKEELERLKSEEDHKRAKSDVGLQNVVADREQQMKHDETQLALREKEVKAKQSAREREAVLSAADITARLVAESKMRLLELERRRQQLEQAEKERQVDFQANLKKLALQEQAEKDNTTLQKQILVQTEVVKTLTNAGAAQGEASRVDSPFERNLQALHDMGFTDRNRNIQELVKNRGDLTDTVQALVGAN